MANTFFIRIILLCWILPLCQACTTEITSSFALQQAITYHNPSTEWATFSDTLYMEAERPNGRKQHTAVYLDVARNICFIKDSTFQSVTTYKQIGNSCEIIHNGIVIKPQCSNDHTTPTCASFQQLKDYYAFLYGLPMRLTADGVALTDTIQRIRANNIDYIVIEARCQADRNNAIWWFYLHPTTYRMERYQFFKTDTAGALQASIGQYLRLSGEYFVGGMNIPQQKEWYSTDNDSLLGIDKLFAPGTFN